ncbi:hypothetical protein HJC23_011296 [Cyclotella cryptica]|uniref:DUF6604 domain-containing protein n=1 Tax=Cyclotella cryptica TaxID=29204 RepID=A0ABD3QVX4_9STRA|eukprot:CCRYP_001691-RA/>CCRYP_001691-RA protein AED:0.31 eAED:0.29 QI:0/-1/0/1/-1/1/1/0/921
MAKGKGKGRNNNKKKNGGGGGRGRNPSGNIPASSSSSTPFLKGQIPDFGERKKANHRNYQTLYSRYKAATHRFLEYMRNSVPEVIIAGDKSVNFLVSAADWMAVTSYAVDPIVLKDLKLCIRSRTRVAESVFGGGDATHKYFLDILVYCWTVLRTLPVATVDKPLQELEEVGDSKDSHLFSAFGEELEMEEEEEDPDIFPTTVPRPMPDKIRLTIEELTSSDDRNDAILFLITLDELMSMVALQYQVILKSIKTYREQMVPESAIIEHLLEAAVTSNFAIQQVQQLEMELQAQHQHLTTPYRLLSTLVLPELTSNVDDILRKHSNGTKEWKKQDIISYLGDCLECFFINPSDEWNRKETIVQDFCSEYDVDSSGRAQLEQMFMAIQYLVILEVPLKMEINSSTEKLRAAQARLGKPSQSHSWLINSKYIGGDRSIHHTIRLLQGFAGVIDRTPMNSKAYQNPSMTGYFGSTNWLMGRSRKIRDMDELLMSTILPSWMSMARHGIVGKMRFPRESELCPLFMQLKYYVDNPRKAVSWSLAFGVHAMLTGILEVDREIYEIMRVSKAVFEQFFAQTVNAAKLSMKEKSSDMSNSEVWKHNLCMVSIFESFGVKVFQEQAIWNPLCSGTIFSVLSLFCNLEAGCSAIDCQAQLRIVMYLYHGLLINDIIHAGEIPLLDIIYDSFKECKALWQGGLPRKGELVQRFWICFGMSLKDSKQMAENARPCDSTSPFDGFAEGIKLCRGRKMNPIEPSELAMSFRRICERDFTGVCDKYHTPEQKRNSAGTEQYLFAVRTNDTLDHLEKENRLLSINFFSVAYYLEQFVCSLGRVLEWESHLQSFKQQSGTNMRQGFVILFTQHLLGALDFAEDPMNYEFLDVPMGVALTMLQEFFVRIPSRNVMWFQAVQSDENEVRAVTNVSQLNNN